MRPVCARRPGLRPMYTPGMTVVIGDYRKLSIEERLELVGDIWDSIVEDGGPPLELTAEQLAEFDRRVAAHRADPQSSAPWEQVRERVFRP